MPKEDKKKNGNKKGDASSSAKAGAKAESTVVANPRLVAAIKSYQVAVEQTQSYLLDVATICQEEQLTKAEVVASIVEARGVKKETAEQQYSRMRKLLTDPDELEALRSGETDLKTLREKTKKTQKNPSTKKQAENREKRFAKAVSIIVNVAKEGGMDRETILNALKSALKKAGVK